MKKGILFLAIFALLIATPAFCATDLFVVEQDDGDLVKIDHNGALVGEREDLEIVTTSDTLTTLESGKTFFVNVDSGYVELTLPPAAAGLNYNICAINGHATDGQGVIKLSPTTPDTFVGCVNSSSATTFAAGDDLDSPHATGDTLHLISPSANVWACSYRIGTWVDGDE